ncbi:MAG: hypothetical protein IKH24_05195 [Bacteroidales bacterium]|jgi:hypothetical protein|nr:hypothetical protein [Bacteroidales bacterium]
MNTRKNSIILFTLTLSLITSCIPINSSKHDEIVHLEQQQNGENPTGVRSWDIRTSRSATTVSIFITDFSGAVIAEASGKDGNVVSARKIINGTGVLELDTRSFPDGSYSLSIQVIETPTSSYDR